VYETELRDGARRPVRGGPLLSLDDPLTHMTFVTTLTLSSGDRHLLDDVVEDIKRRAGRKGVEFKGPHPKPPDDYRVPMQKRLDGNGGEAFDPWRYTVYTRTLRIVGHDGFARQVAGRSYPDAIHVEAEVEQVTGAGRT